MLGGEGGWVDGKLMWAELFGGHRWMELADGAQEVSVRGGGDAKDCATVINLQ